MLPQKNLLPYRGSIDRVLFTAPFPAASSWRHSSNRENRNLCIGEAVACLTISAFNIEHVSNCTPLRCLIPGDAVSVSWIELTAPASPSAPSGFPR